MVQETPGKKPTKKQTCKINLYKVQYPTTQVNRQATNMLHAHMSSLSRQATNKYHFFSLNAEEEGVCSTFPLK